MIRRCAISVLALATAGTLTACSSSGPGDKGTSTPPSSGSSSNTASAGPGKSSASSQPTLTQPTGAVPKAPPNAAAIRKQVVQTSCASIADGWENKGTIHNTTAKDEKVKITIFFTTTTGGTVQAFNSTDVSVAAGKTESWTVSSKFKADKNTSCVLRGAGLAA